MKLYVGNLSFKTTEAAIRETFEAHGPVQEVAIIMDRETGRSRGFAFVTMGSKEAGEAAINGLNGKAFEGRNLIINEARAREDRPPRDDRGGDRGDRGDRGGGYRARR
jgi:RNA recognition motif-containing protein